MKRSWQRRALALSALCMAVLGAGAGFGYWAFVPVLSGRAALAGLGAPVEVRFDALGIPAVHAASRQDALAALGFVTARDRLFHMDLLRRNSAGTLAQIFGPELLEHDRTQRHFGFARVADAVVAGLPAEQRGALAAYARGVNAYLREARVLPVEFQLLGYRPEAWTPRDSMLVVLGMFQVLSDSQALERTRTIIARRAPREIGDFLYSGVDKYTRALLEERGERVEAQAVPVPPLRAAHVQTACAKRAGEAPVGSNGWAIAGTHTHDGRAVVANDMHLDLSVPNVWYRAELHVPGQTLVGLTLPGVPLVIAGSNGQVAWGLTNVEADVLDLVETTRLDDAHYQGARGPAAYALRDERIEVRGAQTERVRVRETEWGPVLPATLLGREVSLRWTALDPRAVDLSLMGLWDAAGVESAVALFNRAGMPPLNALIADTQGRVAWTVTGRYPRRRGFSGREARAHDADLRWDGYLEPDALPRVIDPEQGYVINANQRMISGEQLGSDYGHGYRAYRIRERLLGVRPSTEGDSLRVQLDTRSEPFELYRSLALDVLARSEATAARTEARRALVAWDGQAERDSRGFALLRALRRALIDRAFAGWLGDVASAEPGFELDFADVDTPLSRALGEADAAVFASVPGGRDGLVLGAIDSALQTLAQVQPGRALSELRWGELSRVEIEHPLSALPALGGLLNMPRAELAGCGQCVRMQSGAMGASERMVLSPGHEQDGILHMPGGQSGSPLSAHYADQQAAWVSGAPLPLMAGAEVAKLVLLPAAQDTTKKE